MSFFKKIFGGGNDSGPKPPKPSQPVIVPPSTLKPGMIKCPYCFEIFSHDDVHFKAMTLKESSSWGNADDDFGVEDDDFDPSAIPLTMRKTRILATNPLTSCSRKRRTRSSRASGAILPMSLCGSMPIIL